MRRHRNHTVALDLWDAIARGEASELGKLLADKCAWTMPGRSPLAGVYVGDQAIFQFMARVGELTDDLQSDLIDIFVSDRGAVARYRIRAIRGEEMLDMEHLFMISIDDDGLIFEGVFAPIGQERYDHFFRPQ